MSVRSSKLPRVVIVQRETEFELLLARHATAAQAAFFLYSRGQTIDDVQQRHHLFEKALQKVTTAIPGRWRRARVWRRDLDRFIFEPDDIVVVVGQDGLVANTAKYLAGQPVVGINPNPAIYDGVLVPHAPDLLADILAAVVVGRARLQSRAMVSAELDDGQSLLALNEVFVGVRTHQSARYSIDFAGQQERQFSSGLIVATGTGATGWARSIHQERRSEMVLPTPTERQLIFFVREAFPSRASGTEITEGLIDHERDLTVRSENDAGGVIFGDGIEEDYLSFDFGQKVRIHLAQVDLQLVVS